MTREEKTLIYFKDMKKRVCEDYLLGIPKNTVAYKATMAEKEFYDTAIKALEACQSTQKPIDLSVLNKWIGAEVLDRIRNEMHATAEKHEDGVYYLRDEWVDEIIDKYIPESEELKKKEKSEVRDDKE